MTDEGFVKIFRKVLSWEWYKNANVFRVFMHLLILANHKLNRWEGMDIETGQTVKSYGKIADALGLTVQQVRTALSKLKSTNEITVKTTNKFTLITITNYSTYHEQGKENNKQNNKQNNKRITNEQQTDNKRITTNKKEDIHSISSKKNVKNVKKEKKSIKENDLVYPKCVERKLIDDYFANRIEIKKTMTHRAKELFLKKVQKFHEKGEDVKPLIEKAIIGGWSDIYEAKGESNGKGFRGKQQQPIKKAETKSGDEIEQDTIITVED